jgi:hypothetical protein
MIPYSVKMIMKPLGCKSFGASILRHAMRRDPYAQESLLALVGIKQAEQAEAR